jgi:hypothetical protein
MFLQKIQKLKLPVVLVALIVLTIGFSCTEMVGHASMHNASVGLINTVAMMPADEQQCCDTSLSKNIESWKSLLSVVPREMRYGLLLLILGLIATPTALLLRFRKLFSDYHLPSYKLYDRNNPDLALFNYLNLVYARGILNPKVY